MQRRSLLIGAASLLGAASLTAQATTPNSPALPVLQVWKDPNCGCCGDWVKHLQASGFLVQVIDTGNVAARKRLGMPDALGSCHTARVGGYVIEGHVPAADIRRLLREKPPIRGLVLPGMPVGSPGMEVEGVDAPAYTVLALNRDGSTTPYTTHSP